MKEAERIMKDLKKDNEEIFMGNSEYLQANAKKYLKSVPKTLKSKAIEEQVEEEKDYALFKPNANSERPQTDISQHEKNKQVKNFKYVNNQIRSQLMRAFLKYNPKIHHDNVMKLGQINPDIKKYNIF